MLIELDVPSLAAAFDAASRYAEWSTIAVTIGVFIELAALFIFSKAMPSTEKQVLIFATFLIVVGCGGEYVFGGRAARAESRLREYSDRQLADEQARTARIEQASAWRSIPTEDRVKMESVLSTGRGSVTIAYIESDPESLVFASQLLDAFKNTDLQKGERLWVMALDPRIYSDRAMFGLIIAKSDNDSTKTIRRAFDVAHLSYGNDDIPIANFMVGSAMFSGRTPRTDTVILVGSKPPPAQMP